MIAIQPSYLTVAELFSNRLFRIPDYQRAYSWGTAQRSDLFSDIKSIAAQTGSEAQHFMATVVCLRREQRAVDPTNKCWVLDIVDGQQRLTTLVLLLNAIYISRKELPGLRRLLVKGDDVTLVVLQTNHDTAQDFTNFLQNGRTRAVGDAVNVADRNVLKAIEECQDFVNNWHQGELDNLLDTILHKLTFLLHEITDERTVYSVFEVLNSRGMEVPWFDRLKSILMGKAFELQRENAPETVQQLKTIWTGIYRAIGLRQEMSSEALRFAATLCRKDAPAKPLGEEESVHLLRDEAISPSEILKVAQWVLNVTNASVWLYGNQRIKAVTKISQARLLATSIRLREDFSEENKRDLLKKWESVTFRIYGLLGKDARTKVGDFVRLAWRVVNDNLSVEDIANAIANIGKEFPIDKALKELSSTDCYNNWEGDLRYLMFRYEESLAPGGALTEDLWNRIWATSPSSSIEHIWPQSKAPIEHAHRLGNLMLLPPGVNSSLNDSDPINKAKTYARSGLDMARQVSKTIFQKNGWGIEEIEAREKSIVDWARTAWAE